MEGGGRRYSPWLPPHVSGEELRNPPRHSTTWSSERLPRFCSPRPLAFSSPPAIERWGMTERGNEAVTDFGCGKVVAAQTVWYAGRRWCVSLDREPPYNAVRYLVQRRRVAEKRRLESTASRPPSRLRRSMPETHEALRQVGSEWESIKYPQIADECCKHSFNSMVEVR